MSVWGSYFLDAYGRDERQTVAEALETLFAPTAPTDWASAGVYCFWRVSSRELLYVGIAGDLPIRFRQHNGLRGLNPKGSKWSEIERYFEEEEQLGYTVLPLSELSQPMTARFAKLLSKLGRDAIDLEEAIRPEAKHELRTLEGAMLALHRARTGRLPAWNESPGRLPPEEVHPDDGTVDVATGRISTLLQARCRLRELAANAEFEIYESFLHAVRMVAVRDGVMSGMGVSDEHIRRLLAEWPFYSWAREMILELRYLDRCPNVAGWPA